jgi:peptidoglycan/LPS O-acetylase OafA/YrhL
MAAHRTGGAYRPDIDGLRAIAVLLVVVFHFHLSTGSKNGFMGVDVFFVISGFLITGIIRSQAAQQHFSLADFWMRRLRRLAPVLFVVLALVTAWGALRLLQSDFTQLMQEVLATQFYAANVYFWRNVNYFGLQSGNIFLLHTWSLAVEEQFYLVYPLLLLAALRWGRRFAVGWVLAMALLSFAANLALVGSKPGLVFYMMPTRAWELLLGALLTWVPALGGRRSADLLGLAGAALIAAAITTYHDGIQFPGAFALLPTLGAACLIHAGTRPEAAVVRTLSFAPLVYIGRLSYSLYLVHWPVNVFASKELGEGYTLGWRIAMAIACVLLAAVLHHTVEQPLRRGDWLARPRRFLAAYGTGLALCAGFAAIVFTTGGLPGRLPPEVARIAAYADDKPTEPCQEFSRKPGAAPVATCLLGTPGKAPEWLVYGDSHAWAAQGAFDAWLRSTGSAARFTFLHSCPPLKDVFVAGAGSACRAMNEQMLALAAQDPAIRKVFLVSAWRQVIEGRLTPDPATAPDTAGSVALFQRQFDATVDTLTRIGKEVYVWEPLPAARDHVPRTLALAVWRGTSASLDSREEDYRRDFGFFFDAVARNRPRLRATFSPSAVLCHDGTCAAALSGRPVFFDNSHLAHSGSGFWAQALSAQLDRTAPATPPTPSEQGGPGAALRATLPATVRTRAE